MYALYGCYCMTSGNSICLLWFYRGILNIAYHGYYVAAAVCSGGARVTRWDVMLWQVGQVRMSRQLSPYVFSMHICPSCTLSHILYRLIASMDYACRSAIVARTAPGPHRPPPAEARPVVGSLRIIHKTTGRPAVASDNYHITALM